MNILTTEKRVAVISALVEVCSIRSTVRMTGVAKDTVLKLLAMVGQACLGAQVVRGADARSAKCEKKTPSPAMCRTPASGSREPA
jgi:hypothetical protein